MLGLAMELTGACTHGVSPIQQVPACVPVLGSQPAWCPASKSSPSLQAASGLFWWHEQALGLWQQSPCPTAAPRHWLKAPRHPETGSTGLERCLVTRIFGRATEVPKV